MASVPVLEVTDSASPDLPPQLISQSMAIIDFLDRLVPSPPVFPADPFDRALVLELSHIIVSDTQPVTNLKILNAVEKIGGAEEKTAWAKHWMTAGLEAMEKRLSGSGKFGRFCVGDIPSLADICFAPQLYNARRFGVPVEEKFPVLTSIETNLKGLKWWISAHPDQQQDNDVKPAAK